MIRSMTGHGAASCEHEGMHIAVELRSVNNRSFKAMLRLPDALGSLEGELEAWLARRVARGSVSLTVRLGDGTDDSHERTQRAVGQLYPYTNEFFVTDPVEEELVAAGIAPRGADLRDPWQAPIGPVCN